SATVRKTDRQDRSPPSTGGLRDKRQTRQKPATESCGATACASAPCQPGRRTSPPEGFFMRPSIALSTATALVLVVLGCEQSGMTDPAIAKPPIGGGVVKVSVSPRFDTVTVGDSRQF